jgi:hypothetical protein
MGQLHARRRAFRLRCHFKEQVMNDVERLIAIEAIKNLKARYFRYVDTNADMATRATLFAPDATIFFPEVHPKPMSRAEIASWASDTLIGSVTVHHGFIPEIEILSETTAKAIWPMEDRVYWTGERLPGQMTAMHGFGHYHETYEKIDGEWKIKTLMITRIRLTHTYSPTVAAQFPKTV